MAWKIQTDNLDESKYVHVITAIEEDASNNPTGEEVSVKWNENDGTAKLQELLLAAIKNRASSVTAKESKLSTIVAGVDLSKADNILGGEK